MRTTRSLTLALVLSISTITAAQEERDPALQDILGALRPEAVLPCDTWVALPDATVARVTMLGKNSDRPLYDCQPLVFHPRTKWPVGARLELGRVTIPQVTETWATLGSSPYWCWGYEEGINEHGVAIGNEGVWTRDLAQGLAAHAAGMSPDLGPTGMDLLRLALERARTAAEAVEVIGRLLQRHGQFGSGLPAMPTEAGAYDNSYIVADPTEAWVLETTGPRWIARRIARGTTSISNGLSIGTEWDRASEDLVAHAIAEGWWSADREDEFDFRAAYVSEPASSGMVARAQVRADCSARLLTEQQGKVDVSWMKRIARDRSSDPSLDLDQTASSCVAVLPAGDLGLPVFWWTPATPSNGCYVPFFVHGSEVPEIVGATGPHGKTVEAPESAVPDSSSPDSYWWLFRDLCDQVRLAYEERNPIVRAELGPLEEEFARGLPALTEKVIALREAGEHQAAATLLDEYTAKCVETSTAKVRELLERFRSEVLDVAEEFRPFVGEYLSTVNDHVVQVLEQNDHLAVSLPGQGIFELGEPDEAGRRPFQLTDQVGVSFELDEAGVVIGMRVHQADLAFELVRRGVVIPPELELAKLEEYLGEYRAEGAESGVKLFVQNNRLAIDWPERQMIFELRPPDEAGVWRFRLGDTSAVRFNREKDGSIESMTYLRDGQETEVLRRVGTGEEGGG